MAVVSIKNKLRRGNLLVGNEPFSPTYFDSIATISVGAGGASFASFSSIPTIYKHLQLRMLFPSTPTTANSWILRVGNGNFDANSNYIFHGIYGYGNQSSGGGVIQRPNETCIEFHYKPAGTSAPVSAVIDFLDYANGNKHKTIRALSGTSENVVNTNASQIWFSSGAWRSLAPITNIQISFALGANVIPQHSSIALYGVI